MNNKPILFSGEMIRALLDGRKTQTRRIMKPQPPSNITDEHEILNPDSANLAWFGFWGCEGFDQYDPSNCLDYEATCPYGQPGDYLWVRESFQEVVISQIGTEEKETDVEYRADSTNFNGPWKPSIFMPRWASRLTLKITDVRVEHLHSITYIDAVSEGVTYDKGFSDPRESFRRLWDSINGNWSENPWVWVIEFEVIKKNIDEVLEHD